MTFWEIIRDIPVWAGEVPGLADQGLLSVEHKEEIAAGKSTSVNPELKALQAQFQVDTDSIYLHL